MRRVMSDVTFGLLIMRHTCTRQQEAVAAGGRTSGTTRQCSSGGVCG